jgi:glycosyltransferase involved in cell wall biosynthesis
VGSTKQNGYRKGKELLYKVKELDFVELRLTEGTLKEEELPNFYRQLDYILIASKYEGGPMCLMEGLACGVPIIAPIDVGQVSDFSKGIYHYENSNFDSLKSLLENIYERKNELRHQVEHLTWDRCAEEHDKLFNKIFTKESIK